MATKRSARRQPVLPLGLTTPGERITSLALTPGAATLYATSAHVPLQRYPVNASYPATWICAHTGTTLSPAQWHTYIPDASYRAMCPASG